MTEGITEEQVLWADQQVETYTKIRQDYDAFAGLLSSILTSAVKRYAPESIVQVRAKDISSFAGKIWRKRQESQDPVHQFTDLCGARVITGNTDEVKKICDYIVRNFEIDWENSVDISQRLKPSEFGYRSVHYIVIFRNGAFPDPEVRIKIPKKIYGLKAEIQVRTHLEHSWAEFSHRIVYKRPFKIPDLWNREMAKLAAFLEESDCQLLRVQNGLKHYISSYGAYMTEPQIRQEIRILENVLKHSPENEEISHEIARLAFELSDWKKAARVLEPFRKGQNLQVLRDYGIALCNNSLHRKNSADYHRGQAYLRSVTKKDPADIYALCALAGTYRDIDEYESERLFSKAFEIAPDDPYPLSYYLDYAVSARRDLSVIHPLLPVIRRACKKSRELADAGLDSPWTFYNMGKFSLLLNREYDAISHYAKAVQATRSPWPLTLAIRSLVKLSPVQKEIQGYPDICSLLCLASRVKFPKAGLGRITGCLQNGKPIKQTPVVIVAGATDLLSEETLSKFRTLILEGFHDFSGTIISGGTAAGVCGLVGEAQEAYNDTLITIGYLPATIPSTERIDPRYREIRKTDGERFSAREPLRYWADILASGIRPFEVRLVGISGGTISAAEYRIALMLGAKVGIIKDSGRAAAKLLVDKDWNGAENLIALPQDGATLRAFVGSGAAFHNSQKREELAQHIHEEYRKMQVETFRSDPKNLSLLPWEKLDSGLKESNRRQADHTFEKLKETGYSLRKAKRKKPVIISFDPDEVEHLAEMEHGRWNAERLVEGWKTGPEKNIAKKINPYLVSWEILPDDVREWDRNAVRKLPEMLAKLGYEIYRDTPAEKKRRT
jgi:ppGpp synthetase/RelA/SpoT-type nucleotidyltranferase